MHTPKRNNFLNNPHNDFRALKILIGCSRWIGLTPFSLKANSVQRKFAKCATCTFLFLYLIYECLSFRLDVRVDEDDINATYLAGVKTIWSLSKSLFLVLSVAKTNLSQFTSWKKFFVTLDQAEVKMMECGFQMTRNFYLICGEVSVYMTIPVAFQILQISSFVHELKAYVLLIFMDWVIPNFCMVVGVSMLRLLANILDKRYEYLTNSLTGLKDINRRDAVAEVRKVLRVYRKLYLLTEEINAIFGWQILMCVFVTFISSVSLLSYIIILIPLRTALVKTVMISVYVVAYLVILVTLIEACESMERSGKKIIGTCYDMHESLEDNRLREESLILARSLKQCRPTFSAAGFFDVNRKTLPVLFWAIINYFVIVIQIYLAVAVVQRFNASINIAISIDTSRHALKNTL